MLFQWLISSAKHKVVTTLGQPTAWVGAGFSVCLTNSWHGEFSGKALWQQLHATPLNFICPKFCETFSWTGSLSLSCCQILINLCALILTHPWHVHCCDKHYSVWLCLSCVSLLWSLVASFFKAVTTPRFLWKEDSVTKTRKEVLLKWQLAAVQRPFLL